MQQQRLVSRLMIFICESVVTALIRAHFYATDRQGHQNVVFYYPHSIWSQLLRLGMRQWVGPAAFPKVSKAHSTSCTAPSPGANAKTRADSDLDHNPNRGTACHVNKQPVGCRQSHSQRVSSDPEYALGGMLHDGGRSSARRTGALDTPCSTKRRKLGNGPSGHWLFQPLPVEVLLQQWMAASGDAVPLLDQQPASSNTCALSPNPSSDSGRGTLLDHQLNYSPTVSTTAAAVAKAVRLMRCGVSPSAHGPASRAAGRALEEASAFRGGSPANPFCKTEPNDGLAGSAARAHPNDASLTEPSSGSSVANVPVTTRRLRVCAPVAATRSQVSTAPPPTKPRYLWDLQPYARIRMLPKPSNFRVITRLDRRMQYTRFLTDVWYMLQGHEGLQGVFPLEQGYILLFGRSGQSH